MKGFYITLAASLVSIQFGLAQNLIPYQDPQTGLYGIQRNPDQIVIAPQYAEIIDSWQDSLFIVRSQKNTYGVIDAKNHVTITFGKECLSFSTLDSANNGRVYECSAQSPNTLIKPFFIDRDHSCIPTDYYPCPSWKKLTKKNTPEYLKEINTAQVFMQNDQRDSAMRHINKAISLDPKNPYVYFARADLSFYNDSSGDSRRLKEIKHIGSTEADSILANYKKALALESRQLYKIQIQNKIYDYYCYIQPNSAKRNEIELEARKQNIFVQQNGMFLITSITPYQNTEFEIGLGLGAITKRNKYSNFNIKNTDGFISAGLSYIYMAGEKRKIEAFKIHLLTNIKPFSFGIYPTLYTTYFTNDFIVKPEVGVGFGIFSFNVGYNIHVAGVPFDEIHGPSINIKAYIPMSTTKVLISAE